MSSADHLRASAKQVREAANAKRGLLASIRTRIDDLKKQQANLEAEIRNQINSLKRDQAELESSFNQTENEISKLNSQAKQLEDEATQADAFERSMPQ